MSMSVASLYPIQITVEVQKGAHVTDVMKELQSLANEYGCEVQACFNGQWYSALANTGEPLPIAEGAV